MTPWTNNKAFNVSQFTQRIKGVQYLSKFYFKLLDNENYRDLFEASPDLKDKVENLFFIQIISQFHQEELLLKHIHTLMVFVLRFRKVQIMEMEI